MAKKSDTLNPKAKVQYWESHIQAWQKTDLSQSEYCRKNKLKSNRFWYWRKRIERPKKKDITFVPLSLSSGRISPASRTVRVIIPNGYRIELEDGFDPDTIRQLIHTIREL
jgi:hypothetical protein